jgi:hypothetical protein
MRPSLETREGRRGCKAKRSIFNIDLLGIWLAVGPDHFDTDILATCEIRGNGGLRMLTLHFQLNNIQPGLAQQVEQWESAGHHWRFGRADQCAILRTCMYAPSCQST